MLARIFTAALVALVATTASAFAALENRVALVIGNGAYRHTSSLPNPVSDAKAMAAAFRRLGFNVVEAYDQEKRGLEDAIRRFTLAARNADMTTFFYAGHGVSNHGRNYLVPVDARFQDETAFDFEAVDVALVTKQMEFSDSVGLIILDACRDNPLARNLSRNMTGSTRAVSVGQGLAEMKLESTGKGLAIAFATSPEMIAYDGDGVHSPFTKAMLTHIETPNTPFNTIMTRVTGDVYEATGKKQRPWLNSTLTGEVILNLQRVAALPVQVETDAGADDPAPVASVAVAPGALDASNIDAQRALFELARGSGKGVDYEAYLQTFPNGLFANNARGEVLKLRQQAALQPASAPQSATVDAPGTTVPSGAVDALRSATAGPLELAVTDALRAAPTSRETEAALEMDRAKRREVQHRLNLAGHDVGRADGAFGPRTRRGVTSWQESHGLPGTAYFNEGQLQLLTVETQPALEAKNPAGARNVASAPAKRSGSRKPATRKKSSRRKRTRNRRNAAPKNAGQFGAFVAGAVTGAVGAAILRRR